MTLNTLRRRLVVVLAVTGLVTAVLTVLVVASLRQLDQAKHDRVDRYGPALLATEQLAAAYSDQETGVRGYVASGQEAFLSPYRDGRTAELDARSELRRLLAGRADLLRLAAAVDTAAKTWQTQVAEPVIERTRRDGPLSVTTGQVQAGKQRFDQVRAAVSDLQKPVLSARDRSQAELDSSLRRLRFSLALALLGLLGLAAGTWRALSLWVTTPLARFGAEVDRVEGGDLAHVVFVRDAPAEIQVLAEQVDRMRVRIVQQYALAAQAGREAQDARALVEEQAEDLRRSNAELEQFAYVASHDLQEPLRKVASFCQLIERRYKGQLDERGEQYIEFAVDGAKRMQHLINDLLAFSRVGRLTTGFTEVALEDVLAQAMRQLDVSIAESRATVTHDPLPVVRGEQTLLVQMFQNLVGNGIKFRGDEPPRVHVGVRRDGPLWEFWCADNGIGVEPQYADKIFVIFQRLHGRDAYGGTGIGLAMCKKIVEYHGGRMWLDTTVSSGATFRWTLPADDERKATDDAAAAGPADRGPAGGGRPG